MELDDEIKTELMDGFEDLYEEIESCLSELAHDYDEELLNRLFRAIHSIKGNAAIMQLMVLVDFTHSLEEIAESLRSEKYDLTRDISEVIHLGMDRLRDLHLREIYQEHFENLREKELQEKFSALAAATQNDADTLAKELLTYASSGVTTPPPETSVKSEPPPNILKQEAPPPPDDKVHEDLGFFHEIALQVDDQSQYWEGRSIRLFHWAQRMNQMAGNLVAYEQLAAATYMHDVGMSFISKSILEKDGKLTDDEMAQIRMHPSWGHKILIRMPGWEDAATIVLNHHEHFNGGGYPDGRYGDEIHPGAQILAILDAYFSMTHGRADRPNRRSIIRTMSEINARIDTQFNGFWVQIFNSVIRDEVKAGNL